MDLQNYQNDSYKNIQPHKDSKDEVLNWSIGLIEEVGETMNHIKHYYWGNEEIKDEEIAKEIGDILWYLSALTTSLHLNLDTIAQINLQKLEHRFKKGFSKDSSQHRHELEQKFEQTENYKNLLTKLKKV